MTAPANAPHRAEGSARRRILLIQHAAGLGGSCVSLLDIVRSLDACEFEPVVALAQPTAEVEAFYRNAGVEAIPWTGIRIWHHSTVAPRRLYRPESWLHLVRVACSWRQSQARTLALVEHVQPDLVHLNSMPLAASARALERAGVPFVWHVREPPDPASGVRYRIIRSLMLRAGELIFLSEFDSDTWVGGRRGVVIPNAVNLAALGAVSDRREARSRLGIPAEARTVLFTGGVDAANGVGALLEALVLVAGRVSGLVCLMPGRQEPPPPRRARRAARVLLPGFGGRARYRWVEAKISRLGLAPVVRRLPFQQDVAPLFAASDVVVVPWMRPHFARPVIEAAAMGRPCVAFDVPGVRELVENGATGLLVEPSSPAALAQALIAVLTDGGLASRLGDNGARLARQRFDAEALGPKIAAVYRRVGGW
jgi:glycosyltransferase involved in cell wall biosynthesis